MNKTQSMMLAILLLVVGAMGIAACGGDDDAATATATTAQQSSSTQASSTTPAGGAATTAAAVATTAAPIVTQPAGGGITASDSCALITKSEVADALGESLLDPVAIDVIDTPVSGGTAAVGGCGYTSQSYASSISVTYWYAPGNEDAMHAMVQLACAGKESISDLGDQACWYDQQHVQIQLASGGHFLDIFATMSGDASGVLKTLAAKAIGRM